MFDTVDPRQSLPELERGMLKYWQEEDIFKRSLRSLLVEDTEAKREKQESTEFSFYDGPPFATGLPHYGHLLAGTIKDVIPRYQTMKGKHVQRRFGWDCHGLPVEYEVEKEFGLDRDKIRRMGVKAFNDLCRSVVLRYTKEWRTTVERMGRWVDMDWDYRTMDADYMESIWWVFSELQKQGLIEEGYKPMHICPRCVTPLSNFEVTQGYKEITDQSATVKFRLLDEENTYLLAWTTTPWTLPGNLFLAVHPDVQYTRIQYDGSVYIVADALTETPQTFAQASHEKIGKTFPGKELIGKKYTPLFPYFTDAYPDAFRVVGGDFVTTNEGTGIVHIAPGFGEDDFGVGKREGMKLLQHVTMEGKFVPGVTDFAGMEVKPKDDPTKTDQKIIQMLKSQNTLFAQSSYKHTYPHCWRCDTPLLNYVTSSWFVAVEKIKGKMLKANAKTQWVPEHLRDGRFGKWLEGARDWAISRSRYWGTPLPLWRHEESGEIVVLSSRDELMEKMPGRFTKITIARHGESEGNVKPIYQGVKPGTSLTKNGKGQAKDLAQHFANKHVHKIYTSPMARTLQTAELVAKETAAPVVVDDRLTEVTFGEHEGEHVDFTDLSFVKERRAHRMEKNQIESIYHLPGMENWQSVEDRVLPFIKQILLSHKGEHVVVISHADPIQHFRTFFTGEDPKKLSDQPYPSFANPYTFYWDHVMGAPLDLHKETADSITWAEPDATPDVTLTIVRHGETDWNVEDRIAGFGDRPLTENGRAQAKALRNMLSQKDFDVIITSDLSRSRDTAAIATEGWNLPTESLPLFREQNLGDWEGKTLDEVRVAYPTYPENFLGEVADIPNGESREEFLRRVREAIAYLRTQYKGKRVLLVSHRRWICALRYLEKGDAILEPLPNTYVETIPLLPRYRRIPDVLDCWFESGSMPYAQSHYPFSSTGSGGGKTSSVQTPRRGVSTPPGFPANFIAEGIDQTRGWFYTLTVIAAALFDSPAFEHCVVNGTVLAEDGKKMSKRLKNYPEPLGVVEKHGADAVRFALMHSQAVRGEDMRFSEKLVEETVRSVLLPLWNAYKFFVTYANAAKWKPKSSRKKSDHPLDTWIEAEVQDLVNRMTRELDRYDLSATCDELLETIDRLTNWYIRLSRRRFAGKSAMSDDVEDDVSGTLTDERDDALTTLHGALLTICQVLAPFCPFITEAIYLNLTDDEHGSIHLTRWPSSRALTNDEQALLKKNRTLRTIVSLGLKIRSGKLIKIRQPLSKATIALPEKLRSAMSLTSDDEEIVRQELNVKALEFVEDPGSLATAVVQVNARMVGPRLGGRVQDVIQAGKRGEFKVAPDGGLEILGERFSQQEATILYKATEESADVAADHGIVVSLETTVTPALQAEGDARDVIRAVQKLRKDSGLLVDDSIALQIEGADDLLSAYKGMIERETKATIGTAKGDAHAVTLDDRTVTIRFSKL